MNDKSIKSILKSISMFSSLEDDELNLLQEISRLSNYNKDSNLFYQGEISQNIMILTKGQVSIFKHDDKGNEIVIGYFKPYSLLAEAATLQHKTLPSSATFKSDGELLEINLEKFEKLFLSNANISYALMQSLLGKIELLQQNIHLNIASNSKEKILHFYSKNITLSSNLKKYELASILGMTPETFSRSISSLIKENKLIKVKDTYECVL